MKHCSINQILNAKSAGDIFSADPNIMKTEYRNYAKVYHPDVCHREDVMTVVNTLFAQAKKMLENKDWEQTNVLFFVCHKLLLEHLPIYSDFQMGCH